MTPKEFKNKLAAMKKDKTKNSAFYYANRRGIQVHDSGSDAYAGFKSFEDALIDVIAFHEIGAKAAARKFIDEVGENFKNAFDCVVPVEVEEVD